MIKKLRTYLPNFINDNINRFLQSFRVLYYKGKNFHCPICEYEASKFISYGIDNEITKKYNIIGMGLRENAICPNCYSKDRERLVYLFLIELIKKQIINYSSKVIHFSPEQSLKKNFFEKNFSNYLTADITSKKVDLNLDLQNFEYKEKNFDLVICNHVLEHIDNDIVAIQNIFSILKEGGIAILQVPFSRMIKRDFKIKNVNSNKDRLKNYGQEDHVRIYSEKEYMEKLKKVGFKLVIEDMKNYKVHKPSYGLNEHEYIFFLKK